MLAIPKPQQFAEKVHAYTFPWEGRLNTRMKDLVDLVLLLERGPLDAEEIHQALAATSKTRGTHALPEKLAQPPDFWAADFTGMAREAKLSPRDYLTAFGELVRFWHENALGAAG
ncbi:MAG: nucleotidyl transferase AbiEii/AbiGii toxin family protein [Gemmataceae bacterium]|nr:nucleotidyl transferase AbiEii/AbiGii toxin family protein [Gemmataceae bacterium]